MTPYYRDAMPAFSLPSAPRVFRRKDGQPSAFHYGGEPFVCRLNGQPFTRRMLLNRAAIGLPLPPEAWARCAALERNRLQMCALLDAYAEVTPMPWRVRLAKERARIADTLAQALEAAA